MATETKSTVLAPMHQSAMARISRSAVGRATGKFSRYLGSSTRIQATGRFLRKQLWAWPIIAAVLFGGAGWWVHHSVEGAMREQREIDLNAMADATANALRVWMGEQRINVELFAQEDDFRTLVGELLAVVAAHPQDDRSLVQSSSQEALRGRFKAKLSRAGYSGYFIVAPGSRVIACDQDPPIGKELTGYRDQVFDAAMAGSTVVSKPYRSPLLLADAKGELRSNLPTMFVAGPIKDKDGSVVAALGLRIRPEDNFTRILQIARFGNSGEVYAFDRNGLMLSQSRNDDMLKQIGLLADLPESQSVLTLEVRDPGVNMAKGERPAQRRQDQPLTQMAADAVQGHDGSDADGYRGYRGVMKVGAWRWLTDYDFGIATEIDADEAFRPVYILRRAFRVLMALLAISALGIFFAMMYMARQQKALQSATLAAMQLGQYKLEEKLGAGGMGTVYKARHAMLRRPAAVKLLDPQKMTDAAIARFEREVQLTGTLTHPNTVSVFDFGRTPDGICYYAMEYLEGLNLDDLIVKTGAVCDGRAIFILRQICGSLSEAHATGMVHRDIKPANILITHRGGLGDFVKVLDFGLAKALDSKDQANVTGANALLGTPLYLSPEAISRPEEVDARSDVYAVGAVAYFMLSGFTVFNGATVMEICMKHAKERPVPLTERCGQRFNPVLEELVMRCLSKVPDERPDNAAALLRELEHCPMESPWTQDDATEWWDNWLKGGSVKSTVQAAIFPDTAAPQTTAVYDGE